MPPTPQRVTCPECGKEQSLTILGRFRDHGPKDNRCDMSGLTLPGGLQLPPREPPCDPSPETSQSYSDAPEPASPATPTTDSDSDTTPETPTTPTTTPPTSPKPLQTIPGIDEYAEGLQRAYEQPDAQFVVIPMHQDYERPERLNRAVTQRVEMDPVGAELAARLNEMFYQYTNRSHRSTQKTLGPSQVGTPCDRRLVMHLLGMRPVNPGGDNWASFVGTCVHVGLEKMFQWADAEQGRFVTELKLNFNHPLMPRGTLDLLDRVLFMVDDHKAMGQWSLDKLKTSGPTPVYRTQLHVYGMGARIRGEKVDRVGLIGWPRDKSNLDDLYVWTEPYDPSIAREALARLDRLQGTIEELGGYEAAKSASIEDDCRFCPYHLKDAKDLTGGACNGRRTE